MPLLLQVQWPVAMPATVTAAHVWLLPQGSAQPPQLEKVVRLVQTTPQQADALDALQGRWPQSGSRQSVSPSQSLSRRSPQLASVGSVGPPSMAQVQSV